MSEKNNDKKSLSGLVFSDHLRSPLVAGKCRGIDQDPPDLSAKSRSGAMVPHALTGWSSTHGPGSKKNPKKWIG